MSWLGEVELSSEKWSMNRQKLLSELQKGETYDVLVIGGGATGLGVALDAISRGFKVALVEMADFGKGTSSKATKLLHGGVRYLEKGDVGLVIEALQEREFVLKRAPHLSRVQNFVIPYYEHWRGWYYLFGLKVYDVLSGRRSLGTTKRLNKEKTIEALPNIETKGLKGGILYTDGQFDDTRLCIDLVSTINKKGGNIVNYCKVEAFEYGANCKINGVKVSDTITNDSWTIKAKSVVNATGVFAEQTMGIETTKTKIKIVPARGSHVVIDRSFLGGDNAIMIPKTSDGRILFLVPWHNVVIMGTTDVVSEILTMEPYATEEEINFILKNAGQYLSKTPTRDDILSTFAGLRPLAAPKKGGRASKEISRSHKIVVSPKGLVSVLGGKWTTFRRMGQDTVDKIIKKGILPKKKSTSESIEIDNNAVQNSKNFVHHDLPYSWEEMNHAIKNELVQKAEDLLCRRTRCLLLNKKATMSILDSAIDKIAEHHGFDNDWKIEEKSSFLEMAKNY